MIGDWQTNQVFISARLASRHRRVCGELSHLLRQRRIPLGTVRGTADVWCRDYMPIQVAGDRYVQFRYAPDYVRECPSLVTGPEVASTLIGAERVMRSDLVVDGGNVVGCARWAVLTDKILRENPSRDRRTIIDELRQALAVEQVVLIPVEPGDVLGHADGVVRALREDLVAINDYHRISPAYRRRLLRALRPLEVDIVEMPYAPADAARNGIPSAVGCYLNYLRVGNVVVMPAFGLAEDDAAAAALQRALPGVDVAPLRCDDLARHGGVLNCITWTRMAEPLQIIVTDRAGIEAGVLVRTPYIVISIRDPGSRRPRVKKQPGLRGVLHLAFHDAEPCSGFTLPDEIVLMTPDHAKQIWDFVQQHLPTIGTIVVHCEMGMSRSPAVAAAIAEYLDANLYFSEHAPNSFVLATVRRACSVGQSRLIFGQSQPY